MNRCPFLLARNELRLIGLKKYVLLAATRR